MSVFSVQLAGRVGPAAIGQFQQPSISQVQIAGAPGFGQRGWGSFSFSSLYI